MSVFNRNEDLQTFIRRFPAVVLLTIAIILIQLATYLYGSGPTDLETARRFGALQTGDTSPVEWYRLATHLFVQIGGTIHMLANLASLLIFGPPLERIYGSAKFTLLYFATGMVGGLFILLFSENVIAAGASGSIFGLMGLYLGLLIQQNKLLDSESKQVIWSALIGNMIYTFVMPNISIAAHLGGLVGGIILSIFVRPQAFRRLQEVNWSLRIFQIIVVTMLWFSALSLPKYLPATAQAELATKLDQAKGNFEELGFSLPENSSGNTTNNDSSDTHTTEIINDANWSIDKYNQVYAIMNELVASYNQGIANKTETNEIILKIQQQQEEINSSTQAITDKSYTSSLDKQQTILIDIFTTLNEAADYCKLTISSNYADQSTSDGFSKALDEINVKATNYSQSLISLYEEEGIQWMYDDDMKTSR